MQTDQMHNCILANLNQFIFEGLSVNNSIRIANIQF